MRDVSKRDISTTVLGHKVSMPLGVAPTAMQRMAHPDGECANARGECVCVCVRELVLFRKIFLKQIYKNIYTHVHEKIKRRY